MADDPVDINLEELKQLIKLLRESNVSEFEIRRADYRLRIKQGQLVDLTSAPTAELPKQIPAQGGNGAAEDMKAVEEQGEQAPAEPEEELHEIRSPMVGTFYRSSTPGIAPFIEVGEIVRQNQVLCIIEAMKIMNEIESDMDGEVRKVHVANGQPVEFGELLFSIRPVS